MGPRVVSLRHKSAKLVELPSLSLPEPPDFIADFLKYTPTPPKKNTNEFDKDGRLIKGPMVSLSISAQKTSDNTKFASGASPYKPAQSYPAAKASGISLPSLP